MDKIPCICLGAIAFILGVTLACLVLLIVLFACGRASNELVSGCRRRVMAEALFLLIGSLALFIVNGADGTLF